MSTTNLLFITFKFETILAFKYWSQCLNFDFLFKKMILKNIFKGGWGTDRPYKCPQLYIGRSAPVPKFG